MLESGIKFGEVRNLASQTEYSGDRVQFNNIFNTSNGGVSVVAFSAGQRLDTHTAPAELMVYVLEGEIEFTISDNPHTLVAGQFLLVGEGVRHSVSATSDAKMMLVKVKA
ncbi:MAG: cupin domain-containing protein [Paramuribaculum sp.]|nr:cupin domain-containing protein [Paramuribaculum sp.]